MRVDIINAQFDRIAVVDAVLHMESSREIVSCDRSLVTITTVNFTNIERGGIWSENAFVDWYVSDVFISSSEVVPFQIW